LSWTTRVHPEAGAEVEATAAWYEAHRPGLGLEFVAAIDHALSLLADNPTQFALWKRNLPWRRCVLTRFPYIAFYRVEGRVVRIMAVAHARRRPGYWISRAR